MQKTFRRKNKTNKYPTVDKLPKGAKLATDFAKKHFAEYSQPQKTLYQYLKRGTPTLDKIGIDLGDYKIIIFENKNYITKK